jgi:Spy/CpxP family protein refolding chaperone
VAALALMVGVLVWAALPAAAEEKADREQGGALAARIQDLNLTDNQEAKIAEIRKEYGAKVREAAKELGTLVKEEVEKVRGVLTPEAHRSGDGQDC